MRRHGVVVQAGALAGAVTRALLALAVAALTATWGATAQPSSDYVLFSVNVQDFGYPAESAAVLDRIVVLHETLGVPLDVYLTDVMAHLYTEQFPALLDRLRTSPVVAVSYHVRPPRPYANRYDWLGLQRMDEAQLHETVLRYETHAVDPISGLTTASPGGYQAVAALIGYPPYAAASSAQDPRVDDAVMRVFRQLGARLTTTHGRAINLGDEKDGLSLRPEHVDLRLFEHVGQDATSVFDAALNQAHRASRGQAPYFVGVKVHDNDFFAEQSAWVTVYVDGGKRPDWDPSLRAPLLDPAQREAMWTLYEQTVRHVAAQASQISAVNLAGVLALLGQSGD